MITFLIRKDASRVLTVETWKLQGNVNCVISVLTFCTDLKIPKKYAHGSSVPVQLWRWITAEVYFGHALECYHSKSAGVITELSTIWRILKIKQNGSFKPDHYYNRHDSKRVLLHIDAAKWNSEHVILDTFPTRVQSTVYYEYVTFSLSSYCYRKL